MEVKGNEKSFKGTVIYTWVLIRTSYLLLCPFSTFFFQVNKIFPRIYPDWPELLPVKTFNYLLKSFLYGTLLKSKMLAEVLIHDQRERACAHLCLRTVLMLYAGTLKKKSEIRGFILSRILFYLLCVCPASLHESYLWHIIWASTFLFVSFFTPPCYRLFQFCFTDLRLGFIFLSRQYSGLSKLLLMTYFIILLTIFRMHLLYRGSQLEK